LNINNITNDEKNYIYIYIYISYVYHMYIIYIRIIYIAKNDFMRIKRRQIGKRLRVKFLYE